MAITNFMNLDLPTVSVTLGPEWATELNDALELVDAHDHTSGKGKKVPTAGIDINAHLNFQEYKAYNLYSTQYDEQSVPLTGASNAGSVHMSGGDLYFTNSSGTAIQLTDGGSVVTSPGTVQSLEYTFTNGSLVIDPSDTFVTVGVDTTSSRTITLPLASAVAAGRIYVIKDLTGDSRTNPMTIAVQGSDTLDGETSLEVASDYQAVMVTTNGVDTWAII